MLSWHLGFMALVLQGCLGHADRGSFAQGLRTGCRAGCLRIGSIALVPLCLLLGGNVCSDCCTAWSTGALVAAPSAHVLLGTASGRAWSLASKLSQDCEGSAGALREPLLGQGTTCSPVGIPWPSWEVKLSCRCVS